MSINLQLPKLTDLEPRLTVVGVGGAGCNAVNNMIAAGLTGVEFVVANTDAQALAASSAEHRVQLGINLTEGLGAGAKPEIGHAAAEEAVDELRAQVSGSHMVFLAAGMGGGTGTGAASVIARVAREEGILVVGVVTKPFQFEGSRRMRVAEAGIEELKQCVDTLIVIPNQNLFLIASEKTTFAEAFVLADHVLYSGVACIVDLILKEGLINLDFADVRSVMSGMGTAMMGTGEASGERRATIAAEEAISNPLLDDLSLEGAKGLLLSITGGADLTLYEVDEAASRVRKEVDSNATIIVGATFDDTIEDKIRVSIVASGMERLSDRAPGGFMGMKKQLSTLAPTPAPPPESYQPDNANSGTAPHVMQGGGASQYEPSLSEDHSDESGTEQHAAPALGSPPPVPEQEAAPLQHRLSEAFQPGPTMAASPAHDPSLSGDWSDDPGPIESQDLPYGQADPSSTAGNQFHPDQGNYPSHDYDDGYATPQDAQAMEASGMRWHGPGDVMIEEGYPPNSRHPAAEDLSGSAQANVSAADNNHQAATQFQPQPPPSIVRRAPRRMPTVEDFPPVGQREYHARKGTLSDGSMSSEQANALLQNPQSSIPNRKKGLFARLTGFARKQSDSPVESENRPLSDQNRHAPKVNQQPERGTHTANQSTSRQVSGNDEGAELPVFFSPQRKA